jgi:hypothetical protein
MSKFAGLLPLLLLVACGGGGAPAASPQPADSAEATDAGAPEPSPDADAGANPASKVVEDPPKPTRSAQDILTSPDVVFMFSFNDSDVKQTADSKCTASSGNDPKKMSRCMAKARKISGLDVDGYRFKEKDGKWWWLAIRTQGKVLRTVHKFQITFGPETPGSVTFKPTGKDLGSSPERTPASVTFEVPNEDQIVFNDAKLGKLVYEAKIGIASELPAKTGVSAQ